MTPRAFLLPRVEHLADEPQLASLAVLETVASIAALALGAVYPELALGPEALSRAPPDLAAAADLIELARAVLDTSRRYRRALALRQQRERDDANQLPF